MDRKVTPSIVRDGDKIKVEHVETQEYDIKQLAHKLQAHETNIEHYREMIAKEELERDKILAILKAL